MVADDTPAIEVVLRADTKRTKLLSEKDQLEVDMNTEGKHVDMDRIQEIYDELKAIGADAAEPKARRWQWDSFCIAFALHYKTGFGVWMGITRWCPLFFPLFRSPAGKDLGVNPRFLLH